MSRTEIVVNRFYAPNHSVTVQPVIEFGEGSALYGQNVIVITSNLYYGGQKAGFRD